MINLSVQLFFFIAVGATAALTHWTSVVIIVGLLDLHPLLANVLGWLIAFGVSFTGHYRLTFRDPNADKYRALVRFFLISAIGFLVNETSYALLLSRTQLSYELALAMVLIGVAFFTFIASRLWAFRSA